MLSSKDCYWSTKNLTAGHAVVARRHSWLSCCDRKARAANARSSIAWQQATVEITRHDHFVIACSCHIYMGVVLRAHPVRGESHIQRNTTGEVATIPSAVETMSEILLRRTRSVNGSLLRGSDQISLFQIHSLRELKKSPLHLWICQWGRPTLYNSSSVSDCCHCFNYRPSATAQSANLGLRSLKVDV